jgi:hypothetical protein
MASSIKSIPTLNGKAASSFQNKVEASQSKKATVDFSKQIKSSANILAKAKLR